MRKRRVLTFVEANQEHLDLRKDILHSIQSLIYTEFEEQKSVNQLNDRFVVFDSPLSTEVKDVMFISAGINQVIIRNDINKSDIKFFPTLYFALKDHELLMILYRLEQTIAANRKVRKRYISNLV